MVKTAGGTGLIPGRGTKIPHAVRRGEKEKKKKVKTVPKCSEVKIPAVTTLPSKTQPLSGRVTEKG